MSNEFLVSVANAVLRDSTTGEALVYGKANLNSSLTQTMDATDVRGGVGNKLLYKYFHSRNVEISIEQATFGEKILALQSGQSVSSGSKTVVETEAICLSSGEATLTYTPTSDVTFIFDDNGTAVTVTPSGANITVAGGLDRKGVAIYDCSKSVDRVTVDVSTPPSVVELVMTAEVYDADGNLAKYFQVVAPRFQLDGGYELPLTADGVSTETLTGMALENTSSNCTDPDYYYTATWISVAGTTAPYIAIAATPAPMTLSGSGVDSQLSVLGIRSALYTNQTVTSDCTYEVTSGCATITVGSATGLVSSSATALSGDNAVVTVSYWDLTSGSLTDTVYAEVS